MKKKSAKKKAYTGDEVKRYLGVLHEENVDNMKAIKEILDSHTTRLDSHAEMIGKILEDVAILKGDMDIVKSGLKQKPDYNEFAALQRRVRVLESKVK